MGQLSLTQIVAVIVRLFAVGLVVYLIRVLALEVAYLREYGFRAFLLYGSIGLLIPGLLAFFLWKFPLLVASRLVKPDGTDVGSEDLSLSNAYTVGLVVVGICLLFWTISDAVYWLVFYLESSALETYNPAADLVEAKASTIATVVEFAMALFLIFGSRQLSSFFLKIRHQR